MRLFSSCHELSFSRLLYLHVSPDGRNSSTDSSQFSSTTQPTAEVVAALEQQRQKWKRTVAKSVALMAAVLQKVSDASVALDKFDDAIAALTNEDDFYVNSSATDDSADDDDGSTSSSLRPVLVAQRLQELLDVRLPAYVDYFQGVRSDNGRPSRMIRYWPAATTLLVCYSFLLQSKTIYSCFSCLSVLRKTTFSSLQVQ